MLNIQKVNINILYFLGLVLFGVAGNYCKYQIFFNVDFIFGSIFTMLALQIFGLWPGIIASIAAGSITALLWNHPYAIIIMTFETAAVGLLMKRKNPGFVMADVIYWVFLGIPMVYIFYHQVMSVPMSSTLMIMLKQPLNGIANALIARLLFTLYSMVRHRVLITFRESIFNLFSFFVLMSSLIILYNESNFDFKRTDDDIRRSLSVTSRRVTMVLEKWLLSKTAIVTYLARLAETYPPHEMQGRIEQSHGSDPEFLRMGMTDAGATIVAYSPLVDELGQRNTGKNFADRPYIKIMKESLKPMLSEVVMGRIGVPKPFSSILAPIVKNGIYSGYVIGVIDFERISELLSDNSQGRGTRFTLLDKNSNVIVTSQADQKVMAPFSRGPGEMEILPDNMSRWIPHVPPQTSIMERWKKSYYISATKIGKLSEWELIMEQPIEPFQKAMNEQYSGDFALVFTIFLVSMIFAEIISRRIFLSMNRLQEITTSLPEKLQSGEKIAWPASYLLETSRLVGNFMDMEKALKLKFMELSKMNVVLEGLVEERTRDLSDEILEHRITLKALQESEIRYREVVEDQTEIICRYLAGGTITFVNDVFCRFFGKKREDLIGSIWQPMVYEEDLPRIHDKLASITAQNPVVFIENRVYNGKGEIRWIQFANRGLFDKDGMIVEYQSVGRDISDRKAAEDVLSRSAKEQQAILDTVTVGVAHVKERRILWSNSAFERILGWNSGETWGMNTSKLYGNKDWYTVIDDGYSIIDKGGVFGAEVLMKRKNAETLWCYLSGKAVNIDKLDEGSIWMLQDITERKRSNDALREKTAQLEDMTKNLEKKVQEELNRRVKNEKLLIQQSKLAAMGEMLGAIAHQWRQPLNSLGLLIQNIRDSREYGSMDDNLIDETVKTSMQHINHMSKTIDDFRKFFLIDKEKTIFDAMLAVGEVLSLISARLNANNIRFSLTCITHRKTFNNVDEIITCNEKMISGYKNEFEHVCLNLINNARDAILEKRDAGLMAESEQGMITCEFNNIDGNIVITVTDNGTGIPLEIIDRIFEPYFTIKDESKGTGIGLYMSKIIIEEHMKGSIYAMNTGTGTSFVIQLPVSPDGR